MLNVLLLGGHVVVCGGNATLHSSDLGTNSICKAREEGSEMIKEKNME